MEQEDDERDIPSQEEIDQHVDALYDQDKDPISFPPGFLLGLFITLLGVGVLLFTIEGLFDLIIEYELGAPILSFGFIFFGLKLIKNSYVAE